MRERRERAPNYCLPPAPVVRGCGTAVKQPIPRDAGEKNENGTPRDRAPRGAQPRADDLFREPVNHQQPKERRARYDDPSRPDRLLGPAEGPTDRAQHRIEGKATLL